MRDISQSRKVLLICLAMVIIVVGGILFVLGGSIMGQIPKKQPATALHNNNARQIPQLEAQTMNVVAEVPVPAPTATTPQVQGVQTTQPHITDSSKPSTTSAQPKNSLTSKVRQALSDLL